MSRRALPPRRVGLRARLAYELHRPPVQSTLRAVAWLVIAALAVLAAWLWVVVLSVVFAR